MRHVALGKHGCRLFLGLLLTLAPGVPVHAAPATPVQLAIGSPLPNSLVAGRITLSVSYNAGMTRINAWTVYVDDTIQYSRNFLGMNTRGIQYLELDTRTIPDGNHAIRISAVGSRGLLGSDAVELTVRNGVAGGPDLVPPLLQFRNLIDGDTVGGKLPIELLAEDNATVDLLVSIFVNKLPRFISSRAPYSIEIDTNEYLDPATNTGKITLEAMAFDKAGNRGTARPITLNVVPPGALVQGPVNATPKKEDPTLPISAKSDRAVAEPRTGPAPVQEPMGGQPVEPDSLKGQTPPSRLTRDLPVPVRSPKAPAAGKAPATIGVTAPAPALGGARLAAPPAGRPEGPRVVDGKVPGEKNLIIPLPSGQTGGATLSPARASVPDVPPAPARATPAAPATKVGMPEPVASDSPISIKPLPSRDTMPTGTRMASAGSQNPEIVPAAPGAKPEPVKTVKPEPTKAAPAASPKSGDEPGRLVMVVDPKAKPNASGRLPVKVIPVPARVVSDAPARLPKDRTYRLRAGETLGQVAQRFKVTTRSLLVANGLADGRTARAGSILKVPGSFDVVLNNSRVAFDVNPRVENGIPLAPFRAIFEHQGGTVVYYAETREVRAANDRTEIKLNIGSKEALVNRMVVVMDREAFIDSGRTLVPMSFLEKAMELKAEYDVKSGTIVLVRR